MLIEQIIEFGLRGRRSPGRTCNPTNGYFYDQKNLQVKSPSESLFTVKIFQSINIDFSCFWKKKLF